MPAWLPAAIAAAGSIITQTMSNRANRKMSQYAYNKDLEMWNRQNEYNAPKAQQLRLQQAGLNPHLMYGQGTVGNATQLPQYQAPRQQYSFTPEMNPMSQLQNYLDLKQTDANINNTKGRTNLQQAQNFLMSAQAQNLITNTQVKDIEYELARATFSSNVEKNIADTMYQTARALLTANHAQWSKNGVTPQDDIVIRQMFDSLEQMDVDSKAIKVLVSMLPQTYKVLNNKVRSMPPTGLKPYNSNMNFEIKGHKSNIPRWMNKR